MRFLPLAVVLLAGTAHAGRRVVIETPPEAFQPGAVAKVLFFNRCPGGCVVHGGAVNDARNQLSSIVPDGTYTIGEFANDSGQTGSAADDEWQAIMQCLREVYSPYGVTITDQPPTDPYNEAIVAGRPQELGQGPDVLGIAPLASNCAPETNVISFSFANLHPGSGIDRERNICWTAAQESAHAYGLDHEFMFKDGTSACSDPMTYRTDCGGEKFFRNKYAQCGEYAVRKCKCSDEQNSSDMLLSLFGPGTPITPPPHTSITLPVAGPVTSGFTVHANAGGQRGILKVELLLNGYPWMTKAGALIGTNGPIDTDYAFVTPKTVPDGVIDIAAKAYDDIGLVTTSATVTVMKGAPCTSAASCLTGQKCDAGKCYWDPPAAAIGDGCAYDQQCTSGICASGQCVQPCDPTEARVCPDGYTCQGSAGNAFCEVPSGGGCCSAAGGGWSSLGVGGIVMLVLRRRRK